MKVQEPVLNRDLAGRDGLAGDIAALENLGDLPRETVLLIHGTFANNAASAPAWWQPGSEFCCKLDSSLSQQGSPARCWAWKDDFAWTGDNLESERLIGGDYLAKEIMDLEARPDISRYHIIAHSHGGNVVLHALRSLADDPRKLGAVIFLGTPVLSFSRLPPWLNRSAVAMFLYGMGVVASTAGVLLGGEFRTVAILMAIAFGSLLLIEWWTRPRRQLPIYGSGRAHAFEFADDEAMKALQRSLEFAQRPRNVLKQLFGPKAPPEYAVDPPRPAFWKGLWLDFKKTALFRLIELAGYTTGYTQAARRMKTVKRFVFVFGQLSRAARSRNKSPVQKVVAILSFILMLSWLVNLLLMLVLLAIALSYGTKERPYLPNLIERLQKLIEAMLSALTLPFIGIAALILIIMFFGSFLSVVYKFARLGRARAFQLFLLQGPGAWWMGLVVRNAAFGGKCKKVSWPHELPEKERAQRETISEKLNQDMNALSKKTAAQAGEALYSALAEGEAMQIKDHVRERLTDPKLAHCQYYREGEIINRVAELIASRLHR